jgi:methylase of polypeptide subunit release factors
MPRIAPRTLWRAYGTDALLPLLLRECRVLENASAELRWMKEYVREKQTAGTEPWEARNSLLRLARQRGRGVPLQYLLGSQPFGELDVLCRPGVLIPRYVSLGN